MVLPYEICITDYVPKCFHISLEHDKCQMHTITIPSSVRMCVRARVYVSEQEAMPLCLCFLGLPYDICSAIWFYKMH